MRGSYLPFVSPLDYTFYYIIAVACCLPPPRRSPVATANWYNLNGTQGEKCPASQPRGCCPVVQPGPDPNFDYCGVNQAAACPAAFVFVDKLTGLSDRDVCIVPCVPKTACLGDNQCATGYMSKPPMFRCASCAEHYYPSAGNCIKCPDSPYALIIGFILLVVAAVGLGVFLNKRGVNVAVISIGVDYFQILAIFSNANVQWPAPIKSLFQILSAFNLNIEIVAPECLVPNVSFVQKFAAVLLLPVFVGGFMVVLSTALVFSKLAKGRGRKDLMQHASTMIGSLFVLMYFLYLYETRTMLDVFNCVPTSPPDGHLYLEVVFEQCGLPGGTQMTLIPWAVLGLLVYSVGYPAFIGYTLIRNRELIMEDQLLRAKGVGSDRLTNPHAYDLRKRYSRSYYQFRPDNFFWILIILFRKFCIAATTILFNKNPAFQMVSSCFRSVILLRGAQAPLLRAS